MPRYEWTGVGPFRDNRRGREVDPGEAVTLPEHVGEPQKEMRRVESADDDATPGVDAAETGSQDGDSFDAEAVADQHWNTVVTAVENGDYDDHLDELAAADDRGSVQDAIAERRSD